MTRITVVVDNQPGARGLATEWGFSLWIEHRELNLLYDTGQGPALLGNLAALGLEPSRLDAVVISHGHHDHVGGLAELLRARGDAPLEVWCHPGVFDAHYLEQEGGEPRDIGPPLGGRAPYEDLGAVFRFVEEPLKVWPGVLLLAPVPRLCYHEEPAPGLVTSLGSSLVPDPVIEDMPLLLETASGPVLLTGCAHAGVINILTMAEQALGTPPAWLVGGLHLDRVRPGQRLAGLEHLGRMADLRVAAGHCTGPEALALLNQALGTRLLPLAVGQALEF
jgi:7,8-dihydropterin-6-yl-methyl-4-(beta-D-ribofuranosyl)aminobenzene 5'-phosphate synthase